MDASSLQIVHCLRSTILFNCVPKLDTSNTRLLLFRRLWIWESIIAFEKTTPFFSAISLYLDLTLSLGWNNKLWVKQNPSEWKVLLFSMESNSSSLWSSTSSFTAMKYAIENQEFQIIGILWALIFPSSQKSIYLETGVIVTSKITVNLTFVSVDNGFYRATISNISPLCRQYLCDTINIICSY